MKSRLAQYFLMMVYFWAGLREQASLVPSTVTASLRIQSAAYVSPSFSLINSIAFSRQKFCKSLLSLSFFAFLRKNSAVSFSNL